MTSGNRFRNGIFYMPGDSKKSETYDELKGLLKKLDQRTGNAGEQGLLPLLLAFALPRHRAAPRARRA